MNDEIYLSGEAPPRFVVTLRGRGTVRLEATLELRGPVHMHERRSAAGEGLASVAFAVDQLPLPAVGRITLNARAGEAPRTAGVEVYEGDRQLWVRDLEVPELDAS